jgi:predicted hotdog family 3-hydroxylacyl-ACP dehydratase
MLLLDKVIGYNDSELVASVVINESSLFLTPRGVPALIAIEYMAQTCGAYVGAMAMDAGLPLKFGLLIGTRYCKMRVPWLRVGDQLVVTASIAFHDENLAAFDCKVEIDRELIAEAQLKVFQPQENLFQPHEEN